jgi:glycogen debranching enzyme
VAPTLTAYEGPTFLVVDPCGDIVAGRELGLYHEDTRFLSLLGLRLGGVEPLLLSSHATATVATTHFVTNPALPGIPRGALVVRRGYLLGDGMHCDLEVTCYGAQPVEFDLELTFDADFADVFEVKRQIEARGPAIAVEPAVAQAVGQATLVLARHSQRGGWTRRTEIRFSRRPSFDGRRARFRLRLAPGARLSLCQDVSIGSRPADAPRARPCTREAVLGEVGRAQAGPPDPPVVESDLRVLEQGFERALRDLYALRIRHLDEPEGGFHLAAGVPWFMALFGRDSLIASWQSLPYLPELAKGVLRALAAKQGQKVDPETEEQPGKILHEHRSPGLAGARVLTPRFPYYGSVDATPLFVMVLHALWRRTGDLDFLRELAPNLERAVGWIVRFGGLDGDGFLAYRRSGGSGLRNQGWKDSDDAIRFRDGRLGEPPIAVVEVQGYLYAALRAAAELYRCLGRDDGEAERLDRRVQGLPTAIDRAFWMPERSFWALALDGGKRVCDALGSNGAHLLWCGAALPERADAAARTLLSPELRTGFGVRTLASSEVGFSPISYHNGSVWPHDTALAAAGLARYGKRREAALILSDLFAALGFYDARRLPELFCGFAREDTPFPVDYPTANSPQAWAAGAILLAVTTLLGLEIAVPERKLRLAPTLPERMRLLRVCGLEVAGARVTLEVAKSGDEMRCQATGLPDGYALERG